LDRIEEKFVNRAARLRHRIESKRERARNLPLLSREAALPAARSETAGVRVASAKAGR